MKHEKVMFLYGKLGNKRAAKLYCDLHKCYINNKNLFFKKYKCYRCRYRKEVE